MAMDRIHQILNAGTARLQRCAERDDFFQPYPVTPAGNDLVRWYLDEFGQIINTDCAKMAFLKDGYTPGDPASVRKFHAPAAELVKNLIEKMFQSMFQSMGKGSHLYLMAGGNGSGKSSFCSGIRPLPDTDWVIDSTLGSYGPARQTILRALEQGVEPVVIWIRRSQEDAWKNGVCKRALHGSHATPRDVFEYTHAQVPLNLEKLKSEFPSTVLPVLEINNNFQPDRISGKEGL